jgi:hypothetical protein
VKTVNFSRPYFWVNHERFPRRKIVEEPSPQNLRLLGTTSVVVVNRQFPFSLKKCTNYISIFKSLVTTFHIPYDVPSANKYTMVYILASSCTKFIMDYPRRRMRMRRPPKYDPRYPRRRDPARSSIERARHPTPRHSPAPNTKRFLAVWSAWSPATGYRPHYCTV